MMQNVSGKAVSRTIISGRLSKKGSELGSVFVQTAEVDRAVNVSFSFVFILKEALATVP